MTSHDGGPHERKDHGTASRQPSPCADSRGGKPVSFAEIDDARVFRLEAQLADMECGRRPELYALSLLSGRSLR